MSLYVKIKKDFGDFKLDTEFEMQGKVLGLLGASGCGKSMTLKCIAGIEKPDSGKIVLNDRVLFDSDRHINIPARDRRVGYLFQDYALFPNMTVFRNIMCGAKDKEKAAEFIKRFYLEGMEKNLPSQLSGGQKQRTAMARMLSADPDIILLDEPFSALDNYLKAQLEHEIMDMLDEADKPAIFVSHDRNEAYRLTDTIAVMENGQIADIKDKRELFKSPGTLAATLLTGCKNVSHLTKCENGLYIADDWGIKLCCPDASREYKYAGFRAHYLMPAAKMEETNVFECEIVREIEDTFSTIVLFRNKGCSVNTDYSVLTYELDKDKWNELKRDELFLKIPENEVIWMEK